MLPLSMSNLMKKKKKKKTDRLSALPDVLVMHILCFLNSKYAVQASLSLKKWVNFWKLLTDLDFDSLTLRDDFIKINHFSFRRKRSTKPKVIDRITEYAVSHDVQNLSISVENVRRNYSFIVASSNSIRSLKLKCVVLGCVSFSHSLFLENLVTLNLDTVRLTGTGNFSGYPNLLNLTLRHCCSENRDKLISLSIVAPRLSRLIIERCFRYNGDPQLMISTPSLAFFRIEESFRPCLQTDGLTLLNIVDMDVSLYLFDSTNDERQQRLSQLISMLKCFYNANSIRLSWSTVELLSLFPDIFASKPSPFCNLVSLSIIPHVSRRTFSITIPGHVTTYLLRKCPDANTVIELPSCRKCSKWDY